ncbi:hypothetical protein GQ53DRAFT_831619 [Thozetella sp. PMI_491]|nr:hypothetical protein GQ53DRAFT_831619 [Thozetella sp. PMI_491]
MVNVKNPNVPSRNRLVARASKSKKGNQKKTTDGQLRKLGISKADAKRGARPGLLPNSGPNKAVSSKKQRKLERKLGYALKRKMAAEGEVEMKDVPAVKEKTSKGEDAQMDEDIS